MVTVFEVIVSDAKVVDEKLYGNQDSNQDGNQDGSSDKQKHKFELWDKELTTEAKTVLVMCSKTPLPKSEIFNSLGMTAQSKNSATHLQPLIERGLITYTIKDKPTSRYQKYAVTPLGKAYLFHLKNDNQ